MAMDEVRGRVATGIEQVRRDAREHTDDGAVTPNYEGDVRTAIELLNDALAAEIVCVLRYKFHYVTAAGIDSDAVRAEFLEHAVEEQDHADRIAKRINQLGGRPDMNPANVTGRAATEYREGVDLIDMINEDLVAERIAIQSYRAWIRHFGDGDPTTRRMLEDILTQEEEHANDLHDLLVAHQGTPTLSPMNERNPPASVPQRERLDDASADVDRAAGEGMGQPQHPAMSANGPRRKGGTA